MAHICKRCSVVSRWRTADPAMFSCSSLQIKPRRCLLFLCLLCSFQFVTSSQGNTATPVAHVVKLWTDLSDFLYLLFNSLCLVFLFVFCGVVFSMLCLINVETVVYRRFIIYQGSDCFPNEWSCCCLTFSYWLNNNLQGDGLAWKFCKTD